MTQQAKSSGVKPVLRLNDAALTGGCILQCISSSSCRFSCCTILAWVWAAHMLAPFAATAPLAAGMVSMLTSQCCKFMISIGTVATAVLRLLPLNGLSQQSLVCQARHPQQPPPADPLASAHDSGAGPAGVGGGCCPPHSPGAAAAAAGLIAALPSSAAVWISVRMMHAAADQATQPLSHHAHPGAGARVGAARAAGDGHACRHHRCCCCLCVLPTAASLWTPDRLLLCAARCRGAGAALLAAVLGWPAALPHL